MMGDDGRSPEQVRQHLSPNANKVRQLILDTNLRDLNVLDQVRVPNDQLAVQDFNPTRHKERRSRGGPRKLTLKRTENGFGFTLRHFVVYPPDTYSLLSGDRRYGLRGAPVDRPMDTIFVKSVRPGSGAALAGLSSGDQLVSVNGEPIAGRSYAQVVHLIQASPNYLQLLVVPQEEDLLQLYYGETAHNPLSNQRPSRVARGSPQRSPASSPARRIDNSLHYLGKMPGEPEYSGSSESMPGMPGGGYSLPPNLAGCRLSLDGGSSRRDSQDTTHSSDDSIIMSRFRKSLEQKEEFLKGVSSSSPSPLREFYSRPQKLAPPVWPPSIPASAVPQPVPKEAYPAPKDHYSAPKDHYSAPKDHYSAPKDHYTVPKDHYPTDHHQPISPRGFVCGGLVTNAPMPDNSLRYPSARLGRIQEGGGGGRHSSPARAPSPTRGRLPRDSSPPGVGARHSSPPVRGASPLTVQPLRYVSEKARQFESGLIHPEKIDLYRSEIARLANKRNVPSVVVRRKEFENRAADWRQNRESRSLDSTSGSLSPTPTGNRTIPIGSTKLHCDPPKGYHDVMAGEVHRRSARPRSNSVEGVWNEKKIARSSSSDPPQRHRAVRQDSYLAAVRAHASKEEQKKKEREGRKSLEEAPLIRILEASPVKRPQRPTRLELPLTNSPSPGTGGTPNSTPDSETRLGDLQSPLDLVVKRAKPQHFDDQGSEDERATRRVSYLKATRIAMDSDIELSDSEPPWSPHGSGVVAVPVKDDEAVIEGQLFCKATQTDGKKAHGRSWRAVWAVLRGSVLFLFKDKKDAIAETPVDHERLDLNSSSVSAAEDYTKRRHVFRLSTPSSSEILLQADSADEMQRWLSALASHESVSQVANSGGGQMSSLNVSPITAHKQGIMKNITTTLRNRSPTGVSPVTKNRKASQGELLVVTKPHKTWRQNVSRMAKTLKKIQSGAGSPVSPTAPTSYPEGATIGVPLEQCPKSIVNPYVPYIVELCTRIVEDKGLDVIGIYRVPGNTAAITSLTDAVNKGFKEAFLDQDQRWSDVNVISSLLKLFFRKLPDCLLTTELYPSFIKANKMEDPYQRITSIRNLVQELPDYNHQTLRHLMMHLKLVVEHSDINKMEARNLAIVFGPNLVRANDDNMVTMVTDMSHQCRIVETLIQHADWCFSDEALDSLSLQDSMDNCGPVQEAESAIPNQSLLLGNVHKLEGMKGVNEVSRRDIVTSIITAANKKIKSKTRKGQALSAGEEIYDRGDKRKDNGSGRKGSAGDADTTDAKSIAGVVRDTVRVFSESIIVPTLLDTDKVIENKEIEPPKQVTADDGTIITYQGLSETTQARIKRFELETKAMLQRDKVVNNKDWLKPSAPPAIGSKIAERGQTGSNESLPSPLAKWKHLTSSPLSQLSSSSVDSSSEALSRLEGSPLPSLARREMMESRLIRGSSFDSLTDSSSDVGTTNHLQRFSANSNGTTTTTTTTENATSNDLVSALTLTFDAKLKSLGLTSPTDEKVEEKAEKDETSFRDPSLHRSFTSPNLEFKMMEFPTEADREKAEEKALVEKDDEKENCAVSSGKLKRSESFKQREEKKENKLLRRSESLNKKEGSASKLKRSDSLTKTEKTDLNLTKRRQALEAATKKMKRKTGGGGERSIKRRHTVGGTKDFDKAAWLDNKEREASEERRTSSPDLSTDTSRPVLVLRPHSLVDSPLESHI